MNWQAWASALLLIELMLVGLWDWYAIWFLDGVGTVSDVVREAAAGNAMIPLLVGMLMGHLFWPVRH